MQARDIVSKKTVNSLFTWATSSWYTKLMFGFILLIITIRLATTCISAFGMEIGCEESYSSYPPSEEMFEEYGPKLPPKE